MFNIALATMLAIVNPAFDHEAHVRYCQKVRSVAEHYMMSQQYQMISKMVLPGQPILTRRIAIDARNTPIVSKHGKRRVVISFGDKWQTICHES